jgi:hypothetical protein
MICRFFGPTMDPFRLVGFEHVVTVPSPAPSSLHLRWQPFVQLSIDGRSFDAYRLDFRLIGVHQQYALYVFDHATVER